MNVINEQAFPWVNVGSVARKDSSGWPACQQCGRRLSKCKGKKYVDGPGYCCVTCYNNREGYQSLPPPIEQRQLPSTPKRSKRPYETLSTTQRWKRRKQAKEVLMEMHVPPAVLVNTTPSPAALIHLHSLLSRWLQQLHNSLLHSDDWKPNDINTWKEVVDDIQQHWQIETKTTAFPKLHMLRHAVEFAERYRFLGRASESQIESFHAQFNALFHKQHRNMSNNTSERLRRCLSDAALRVVQPIAKNEI